MSVTAAPDRLRSLVDLLLGSLGSRDDGRALAARAAFSRFHFDRLVRDGLRETPAAFRRRLVLERAAWQLSAGASVLDAALDAGYGSSEAFSRAFARRFDIPPSRFAGSGLSPRVPAPNGVHFHPPAGLSLASTDRSTPMDLSERLVQHDLDATRRLLEQASALDDESLDRRVRPGNVVLHFDGPEETVRDMLDKLIWTREVWVAAIEGESFPEAPDRSMAGLRARLESAGPRFGGIVRRIRDIGEWDTAFVDALCDPPVSFSYGGVVAHVTTHAAHRRHVLAGALRELGVADAEPGDPMHFGVG